MSRKSSRTVMFFMDHPRRREAWIVKPAIKDGQPVIVKIARLIHVPPATNGCTNEVCVSDWGADGETCPPEHYTGKASGYGYNRLYAALEGCTIGGVKVDGWISPSDFARRNGWEMIGDL